MNRGAILLSGGIALLAASRQRLRPRNGRPRRRRQARPPIAMLTSSRPRSSRWSMASRANRRSRCAVWRGRATPTGSPRSRTRSGRPRRARRCRLAAREQIVAAVNAEIERSAIQDCNCRRAATSRNCREHRRGCLSGAADARLWVAGAAPGGTGIRTAARNRARGVAGVAADRRLRHAGLRRPP